MMREPESGEVFWVRVRNGVGTYHETTVKRKAGAYWYLTECGFAIEPALVEKRQKDAPAHQHRCDSCKRLKKQRRRKHGAVR